MSDLKREIIIQNLSEYNYVTISSPDGFYNEWGRSNFECKFFDISVIISCDGTQYYLYIDNYEVACSYRYRELLHAFYGNEHINKTEICNEEYDVTLNDIVLVIDSMLDFIYD